jgi:hypothetical protein
MSASLGEAFSGKRITRRGAQNRHHDALLTPSWPEAVGKVAWYMDHRVPHQVTWGMRTYLGFDILRRI